MKYANVLPPDRKQLVICRHAKSSWDDASLSDVERPLNKRGRRDAPEMGRRLAERGLLPDLILASHATRAWTTAEAYADRLGYPPDRIQVDPGLYTATAASLLALVRALEPRLGRILLVGHNPECTAFANLLGNLDLDNLPTGGIVALEFHTRSWQEILPGQGQLLFVDFPKNVA
ncbi:histidine phosphatase family protein [uncultured Desulfobulbus sp.]|uniref:SixA phosphatase family protein n=1 Tax=uncultured Desulfobulbus sp. TaxID=239745 RepID=UPI00261B0CFB|nr:histidine phosphatase family protein [uncultured Desulfobulbus sp.]